MNDNRSSELSLPDDAYNFVWRIFGTLASPLNRISAHKIIEINVKKFVSLANQPRTLSKIRSWFDAHENQRTLRQSNDEQVAEIILNGIGADRANIAIWAVGSIDVDIAISLIRSRWTAKEIASFVNRVLDVLKIACDQDLVLDATQFVDYATRNSFGVANAKIPKDSLYRNGCLETFMHLHPNKPGFDLVFRGLNPAVENLIELAVKLTPKQIESFIEKVDHPVVQLRANHQFLLKYPYKDRQLILNWITEDSCDALIALAILNALIAIDELDNERRYANRKKADKYQSDSKIQSPQKDLDVVATTLLTGLVEQLSMLNPIECVRWIGELLSIAPNVLSQLSKAKIPPRIQQLENECSALLTRIVVQTWSKDLIDNLCVGLRSSFRSTWTRHLSDLAWNIRDIAPALAVEIAKLILDEYDQEITKRLDENRMFFDYVDWQDKHWVNGLGVALVLSCEELDLQRWVDKRCQNLQLSAWDAEQNCETFHTAGNVAQHYFLIAFHAILVLQNLNRKIDPVSVRSLAESLWAHCNFIGKYFLNSAENSLTAEFAARTALLIDNRCDEWLLNQAQDRKVGPRVLWALFDQRSQNSRTEYKRDAEYEEMITREFISVASNRFGDGGQFSLESLDYWGRLWIILGAVDEAEQCAKAIMVYQHAVNYRSFNVLVLKLLAMVASKRKPNFGTSDYIKSLYNQLWPSTITPIEECDDRKQVDDLLEKSMSLFR